MPAPNPILPRVFVAFLAIAVLIHIPCNAAAASPTTNTSVAWEPLKYEAGFVPDKKEAFLGEEIMVSFVVKNTDDRPIALLIGGDGRGIRPTRFRMSALDSAGNKVLDPYPDAEHMNLGGFIGPERIAPGLDHKEPVPISKYCAFTNTGVYTVTCRTTPVILPAETQLDQFFSAAAKQPEVVTTFTLTLKEPSSAEIQRVIAIRRAEAAKERYQSNSGMSSLRAPLYLKPLLQKARAGDLESITAIGEMETTESTEALIRLAREGRDSGKSPIAITALSLIVPRLPNPMYYQKHADHPGAEPKMSAYEESNRQSVARTWRPEMAAPVRELARRLAANTDQQSLELCGRILAYIGTAEDLPAALAGYTHAIEATKTLPFETHQYFRPRGCAYVYRFTIPRLHELGAAVPMQPKTPGECAAYLLMLQKDKTFRPADWPQQGERMLDSDIPYMRELVLDFVPEPVPEAVLARMPQLLNDSYVDLQISACKMAKKHPRAEYKPPLLNILKSGKEKYLLNFATEAALANGIPIDEVMEIWVGRLGADDLGKDALIRLLLAAYDGSESSSQNTLTDAEVARAKSNWTEFIKKNRDKLRVGRKFKPADPEFEAKLFPEGFTFFFDNKPWPAAPKPYTGHAPQR